MNVFVQLALAVGVALLLGRLIRYVHMPNVTAYLVAGLLAGPCVFGLISTEGLNSLSFLTELALGFIAYSIGGEFKLSFLKQIGKAPYIVTLFEGLTATALVDIVLIAIGTPVPEALMFGAIAAATAPAATLMVVRQYKAKGPVTSILLPVVAMDDALGLMLFAVSTAIAKGMLGGTVTVYSMLLKPVLEILESLLLGAGLCAYLRNALFPFKGEYAHAVHCLCAARRRAFVHVGAFLAAGMHDARRCND
jgi:Kef-type K+ transport system membrane component KefB